MPADMKPATASARRLMDDPLPARTIALRAANDPPSGHTGTPALGPVPLATSSVSLTAALIAIRRDAPMVLTVAGSAHDTLPSCPFQTPGYQALDGCLRDGVAEQTGVAIGHAEQLLAFTDRSSGLAIGYLALTRALSSTPTGATWRSWYEYLPWEDWRQGRPTILASALEPRLRLWAAEHDPNGETQGSLSRGDRLRMAFGLDRTPWNEERAADRFELLVESGLLASIDLPGRSLRPDHARVLANAIARLRTKLKTRPVIFELMEREFTLFELQKTVEAILGPHLHKQNFRRLVESAGLVEPTGEVRAKTGGRPAKLFRFRHEVLMERPAPGVRVHAQHG
jgi:hypothetical protein